MKKIPVSYYLKTVNSSLTRETSSPFYGQLNLDTRCRVKGGNPLHGRITREAAYFWVPGTNIASTHIAANKINKRIISYDVYQGLWKGRRQWRKLIPAVQI